VQNSKIAVSIHHLSQQLPEPVLANDLFENEKIARTMGAVSAPVSRSTTRLSSPHRTLEGKQQSFLSFPYVCPEPVLVK
jgi:hypothetical protein